MKPKIKAIFSMNTGRSGSAYLAKLLGEAGNCFSQHEPAPDGFGPALQAFNRGDAAAMTEVARVKARNIEETNARGLIYVETSHCFIKGFGWPLMEMVDPANMGIIILRRDPEKIAQSMFRIGTGALSYAGQKYYLTPDRQNPAVTPPSFLGLPPKPGYRVARACSGWLGKTRKLLGIGTTSNSLFPGYQRASIKWYIDEMAALEHLFREKYPQASYFEIDIEMLNDTAHLQRLCDHFGIDITASDIKALGTPVNLKR